MASDDLPSSQRGFWAAEKILSERRERGERLVLVQWEGTDDNGEKWKPTWEPVGNCTEELVEEWEEEKRCTFALYFLELWRELPLIR